MVGRRRERLEQPAHPLTRNIKSNSTRVFIEMAGFEFLMLLILNDDWSVEKVATVLVQSLLGLLLLLWLFLLLQNSLDTNNVGVLFDGVGRRFDRRFDEQLLKFIIRVGRRR
jgi:hypothetical protein